MLAMIVLYPRRMSLASQARKNSRARAKEAWKRGEEDMAQDAHCAAMMVLNLRAIIEEQDAQIHRLKKKLRKARRRQK